LNGGVLPWDDIICPEEPYIDEKLGDAYQKRVDFSKKLARYSKKLIDSKRSHNAETMIPDAP
jgi:hypothetical protein